MKREEITAIIENNSIQQLKEIQELLDLKSIETKQSLLKELKKEKVLIKEERKVMKLM